MVNKRSRHNPWVVLVTAYIMISLCMSQMYIMGTMFPYMMDWFNTSRAETAVIQSTVLATFPLGGIFYGNFISRMGPKFVCITGTLIGTAGLVISFFATSLAYLTASLGVLFSLGFAMQFMACTVIVGRSFEGRQGIVALSILSTAVGVGAMAYNLFVVHLLNTYGMRGTLLILAAMASHSLPLAMLWPSEQNKETPITENNTTDVSTATKKTIPSMATHVSGTVEHENASQTKPNENAYMRFLLSFTDADVIKATWMKEGTKELTVNNPTLTGDTSSQKSKLTSFMENKMDALQRMTHVLRNVNLVLYIVANMIITPISQIIMVIAVDWTLDKGFTQADGSYALMVVNGFNIVGRIAPGFITLIPKMTTLSLPIIGSLLGCSSYLTMAFVSSFPSLLITCALSGITIGLLITSFTVTVVKLVGKEYMPDALGIVMTSFGIGSISAGPLTGYIRDMTGSYSSSFLAAAAGMLLGTGINGVNQYLRVRKHKVLARTRRTSIFYVTNM